MNDNLDDIDPSTLIHFESIQQSDLIDSNLITPNLIRTATTAIIPVATSSNLLIEEALDQNFATVQRLVHINPANTQINDKNITTNTNQSSSDNHILIIDNEKDTNEFIDLTKENDDVLIISNSPPIKTNSRRTARKQTSRLTQNRSQLNDSNDNDGPVVIEVKMSRTRPFPRSDPNRTIVLDDDRQDLPNNLVDQSSIVSLADSEANEIVDLISPNKRIKINPNPTNVEIQKPESSSLPKCPVCLDNLDEIKQRDKRLMATYCGHVLCNMCLDEHFKQLGMGASGANKKISCPTCRTSLTRAKIRTLYL